MRVARIWLARRDLASNLTLFGKQLTNVGRAEDFFPSKDRERFLETNSELGPNHDGYRLAGLAMSAARAKVFRQKLAHEVSTARQKFIDPATENGYRNSAAEICQVGAAPFFVVTPTLPQSAVRFRQSPPPAPVISFNDCQKFPTFYDTRFRIDDAHLTQKGAEEFTRLLAQEFVRRVHQPPDAFR